MSSPEDGILSSRDGGSTFRRIPEGSTGITDIDLSNDGEALFASTSGQGTFRLARPKTRENWVDVTPEAGQEFRTVTTSPHNPEVVVTAVAEYGGLDQVFVSQEGGDQWTQ